MAQYSFNTSPNEETAVTWTVARFNAERAKDNLPPVTNAQYLRGRINTQLNALIEQMRQTRRAELEQKYEDADAATRTSVNTALGYTE